MSPRLLFSVLALALASPASAHDLWANGVAVPEWVKSSCCGPADAHMDPEDLWHENGRWGLRRLHDTKADSEILPSQDGHFWVFFNEIAGENALIYCFFVPQTALEEGNLSLATR